MGKLTGLVLLYNAIIMLNPGTKLRQQGCNGWHSRHSLEGRPVIIFTATWPSILICHLSNKTHPEQQVARASINARRWHADLLIAPRPPESKLVWSLNCQGHQVFLYPSCWPQPHSWEFRWKLWFSEDRSAACVVKNKSFGPWSDVYEETEDT